MNVVPASFHRRSSPILARASSPCSFLYATPWSIIGSHTSTGRHHQPTNLSSSVIHPSGSLTKTTQNFCTPSRVPECVPMAAVEQARHVAIRSEFAVYGSPCPYLVVDDGGRLRLFRPLREELQAHPRSQRLRRGGCRCGHFEHGAMVA